MPTPGAERPIHRVPRGLPGPGGIGSSPSAQAESGGYHHGFRALTTIEKRPIGVGKARLADGDAHAADERSAPVERQRVSAAADHDDRAVAGRRDPGQ